MTETGRAIYHGKYILLFNYYTSVCVSCVQVTGAVASKHVDRPAAAAAAVTSSSRTMAPMDYWRAVLPLTPMPQAIHDLLIHSTGIYVI